MDFRVGFGYDSHRFALERKLVLGGIAVPYHLGLAAHSDGDVLIHAICDSLLGAAGLKDIGTYFPDNDDAFHNIDSTILLKQVVIKINDLGWRINNLDCTLVLEEPKIKPFVDPIIENLANILEISIDRIAVKAKTNEKMGSIGRGEGIAAFATVSLVK